MKLPAKLFIFISFLTFCLFTSISQVQAQACVPSSTYCYQRYSGCQFNGAGKPYTCLTTSSCTTSGCSYFSVYGSCGFQLDETVCAGSSTTGCTASTSTHFITCGTVSTPPPTPAGFPCNGANQFCAGAGQCAGSVQADPWCSNGSCCTLSGGGGSTPPPPSCVISLAPNPASVTAGNTTSMTATITAQNGTLNEVDFSSSNTAIATVTSPAVSSPYSTTITGLSAGASTITATGIVNGAATCSTTATVNVANAAAWWQAIGGDAITNANLQSTIPVASCVLPGCNPHFILDPVGGGIPGNIAYAGTTNLTTATTSSKGWLGQTTYQGKKYDSSYFTNLVPTSITFNTLPSVANTADFTGGVASDGYYWYKANGDLTLASNISVSNRKIIVFVNGGDFNINAKINIATKGTGFFMVIVGKDANGNKGNINVASTLTGSPALEGIYVADNNFNTAASANTLYVRGTVVSWGSVSLQRNLANNGVAPAETFEYAPDQVMLFPRDLIQDRNVWQEVLP